MIDNTKRRVRKTSNHVRKYKKTYAVVTVAGVSYLYGVRRGTIVTAQVVEEAVAAAKLTAVDEYLGDFYRNGIYPLTATEKQLHLYLGALVNAGEMTQEVAKEAVEFGQSLVEYYKS